LNDPEFQEEQLGAKGQQLPINPDTKWSIGLEYEIPGLFGNVDFWARYDHYWQAEMYHDWWNAMNDAIDGSGNKLIEDQESGDVQVSLSVENDWTLTLSVWNVWDDRNAWWIDSGYDYAFGAEGNWKEQGGGRYVNMPGYQPPREFELSFTKRFD
jgi:outer membrane receptor protein involved in Fe transport